MSNRDPIRIGTRDSELATWQAKQVALQLNKLGHKTELIFVKSEGDIDLTTPLTEMGGKGVFTKALDNALLSDTIDLAVHSFKDLPTENPLPLKVAAIMEREDPRDTLVAPGGLDFLEEAGHKVVIATSSNRRRAQWLNRYPHHEMTNIRGNVNTRLRKVKDRSWNGAIFAAAGLLRIDLGHHISQYLDWMVPAPAQGAMAVMIRKDDPELEKMLGNLNHDETALCTTIERDLLHDMEAGCSAPVGAYARINNGKVLFKAIALTLGGQEKFEYEDEVTVGKADDLGHRAAEVLLKQGASKVIDQLRK